MRMMTTLLLRRANVSHGSCEWQHDDYDVFDGDRSVGRIYRDANKSWFWGISFQLTGRKSYGTAKSLGAAKAAFRAEYAKCPRAEDVDGRDATAAPGSRTS